MRELLSRFLALVVLFLVTVGSLQGQSTTPSVQKADAAAKASNDQDRTFIQNKATHLIIPHLEFRATTISDGVEFLRQESRRLDTDSNEENRGVNILLILPEPGSRPLQPARPSTFGLDDPPLPTSASAKRITLTMDHIPLLEALRYIAIEADLKLVIDQYAICLVPPETNLDVMGMTQDRLLVAEFQVPLAVIGMQAVTPAISSNDKSPDIARLDPKPWLSQKGVTFPEGASAAYVPSTQRLVVRNTKGNLDRIQALLELETSAK